MASTTTPLALHPTRQVEDNIIVLDGATWADFQRLLEIRGDRAGPRLAYLEGRIEIMSPSSFHEWIKSIIGCLVEAWCLERGVEFSTYGSWLLEDKEAAAALEPDECYVFGEVALPQRPDLAIEVVWTSGGPRKLEIYRRLRVQEVWIWKKGVIQPYLLGDDGYTAIEASVVLPGIDLGLLATFVDRPTTSQAIRDYRAALNR